jgi:endonuclease/exonuclease/phosphatase family metal-dependent hydrolase
VANPPLSSLTTTPLAANQQLGVVSFNIQGGIHTQAYHHYLTRASWQQLLPHSNKPNQLKAIAKVVKPYDIVGLQEVDGGSFRSSYINQLGFIAKQAGFPFDYQQTTRNLGRLAQYGNGFLSRYQPCEINQYSLPGLPGRGAIIARLQLTQGSLVIVSLHLALSKRAQNRQLAYVKEQITGEDHVILMGDLNCRAHRLLTKTPLKDSALVLPTANLNTFPSWRPRQAIDHILVTASLAVKQVSVLPCQLSDHLPIAAHISLPATIKL